MHLSTYIPASTFLAQTAGAGQTVGSNVPSVAYWLAIILVTAGLGLIVIVLLAWLRGRDPATESHVVSDEQAYSAALSAPTSTGSTLSPMANYAEAAPTGTTQEAERLLRLMGEAEELCTRLARDLDERAERVERLLARAQGMIGEGLSEPRLREQPYSQQPARQAPAPQPQPQPYIITQPQQPRPEIITRPIGVPVMATQQTYQPAPTQNHSHFAAPAPAPAPAPRAPSPPPIPQPQYFNQPAPAPAANSAASGSMYGQAYPAEAEVLAQQIFRLADAGLTPAEIAQRLGQHTGKVELIIALRNA